MTLLSVFSLSTAHAADEAPELTEEDIASVESAPSNVTPPAAAALSTTAPAKKESSWVFLLPAFVVHGIAPSNGANDEMPRKLDRGGRSVATPGFGFSYQGPSSLDITLAMVKDCYDNYAGAIQMGQFFKWRETTRFGYTVGFYIRQTPLNCYTQTVTTPGAPGSGSGPGGRGPARNNTFTSTTCAFQDNLPLRYTTTIGGGYVDIIPTPFLNFSTAIYKSASFEVDLKLLTNFYLSEFGLAFPF